MLLKGFLEAVDRFQANGWAFDTETPDAHTEVELLVAGVSAGKVLANRYRPDLEQGGIGRGDHSFVYSFTTPLTAEQLAGVRARLSGSDGPVDLPLMTEIAPPPVQNAGATALTFSGEARDDSQWPVFVLGSVRSGTSAVAQALIGVTRYRGYHEGHLLDLLAHLSVAIDEFYARKKMHLEDPNASNVIRHVPIRFFRDGIDSLFVQAIRSIFPGGYWIDKTPTPNMLHIAPILRRIWPNARFIFLKRRAFENLMSRARKFEAREFARDCLEWAEVLRTWGGMRHLLQGCALQIDQDFMAHFPARVASEIAAFLSLDAGEADRVRQALSADRPERTGDVFSQVYDEAELGWNPEQWRLFNEVCGAELAAFGYSRDKSYYASDDPALRMQRI
jgi:hypothetical protein